MLYYLDSSALVKLYIREAGTEHMLLLAGRKAGHQLAILALAQVEVRSAFRKRQRAGEMGGGLADELLVAFERHLESRFVRQGITGAILDLACKLLDEHRLTSFDAVQLAGYFAVKTAAGIDVPIFVCADRELLLAAEAEGIPALDPSSI
ncbi:MAG TPA: type II toxin-antitoxin system VapC family toxin [Candidatus Sulfotelmatobacter sp.]